jgi:hypothetical protein
MCWIHFAVDFFFLPQQLVRKTHVRNPVSIVNSDPFLDGSHLSLQFCIIHSFSFPPWSSSLLLSPLPLSYLPHKIYLLSPFALRELCKRKWRVERRDRNWWQNGGSLTQTNLGTGTKSSTAVQWLMTLILWSKITFQNFKADSFLVILCYQRVDLGGLVVSVLATGPKVRGFDPDRGR